jgi:hypothetical protein
MLIQTIGLISTLLGAYDTEIIPEIIGALPTGEVVTDGTWGFVSSKANWAYCNCQHLKRI